jgi:hypothetical protein
VRGEGRDAHRDERPLRSWHRADGRQELIRPRPIDGAQEGLAALREADRPLAPIVGL